MKILVFGDIVSRIGREAVKKVLPELKAAHDVDLTIGNAENLAHGKGVTTDSLNDLLNAGVDFFTSGNHVWDKKEVFDVFSDPRLANKLIRPANYPPGTPGEGSKLLSIGTKNVLVVNLLGRVFSKVLADDPFRTFDEILAQNAHRKPTVVLVDFHGDATSERVAFGWHADGRATAVWGTHTHVPTRDERILPGGTAYITDVGMTGFRDGVLGVERPEIIRNFMTQLPVRHEIPESGEAVVNAVVITTDGGRSTAIEHVQRIVRVD
ncbi:MAG TPA: TIGR00282 family metallophosphoesterase [Candidatus Eisenbacteria bacterium]|nr:TIGR00282 family metallophosphoesterase [Candidatus Eisenbacteria bacterium]